MNSSLPTVGGGLEAQLANNRDDMGPVSASISSRRLHNLTTLAETVDRKCPSTVSIENIIGY